MVRVRFAPSPTGSLHVGGLRTALFNYFFAKSQKGQFILRIEDTDQQRLVEGAVQEIQESLKWLGITWDELVIQSTRLDEYRKYAQVLLDQGKAREDDGAIRFITPKEGKTSWRDLVGDKEVSFENKEIEDFIILKKDGFPTYHLANVVDDHLMQITHVIRGDDWISSTPKHLMLYEALTWNPPQFAHLPNVLGTDGKKLSKRRGAKGALDYKEEGILSEALVNYLMLLGWSAKNDREILTAEEIEKEFDIADAHVSPAVFDERKLFWMNGEYIRLLSNDELIEKLKEFDPKIADITHFEDYVPLAQTRMKTLAGFRDLVVDNDEVILSDNQKKLAKMLSSKYSALESWDRNEILRVSFEARDETHLSTKDLYIVLTGKPQGLPLAEKVELEGKEERLKKLASKI